jgi:Tol biopolymer transport system component
MEVRSRYVNEAFTWEGTWRQDGQYILAVSDKDGSKVAFQIRSNYEIQQVGQNFLYARC